MLPKVIVGVEGAILTPIKSCIFHEINKTLILICNICKSIIETPSRYSTRNVWAGGFSYISTKINSLGKVCFFADFQIGRFEGGILFLVLREGGYKEIMGLAILISIH